MDKKVSLLDKYSLYVWAIVILLVVSIMLVPFVPGVMMTVFGVRIFYTPALILPPVLMGIVYAVLVSYETPKMSVKKKKVFRTIKLIDLIVFYTLFVAVITKAAMQGIINFK